MKSCASLFRLVLAASAALILGGCQSVVFAIANRGVAAPDTSVVYDAQHGLSLDIYRPANLHPDAPVLVFFYGGSWQHGARAQYRFIGRRLASTGAVVMVADYRKGPQTPFPGFMRDGARAVAWARRHARDYGGDPARLFIAGHSAGAQIAALLGTDARYLEAEGVPLSAIAGVIGLSGPYNFSISGKLVDVFGPPAQWPQAQAIGFVDGDEPPFLLVAGTDDKIVAPRQTDALAARLRAQGDAVQVLHLPGGSHFTPLIDLYKPERDPVLLQRIAAFLQAP